MQMPNLNLFEEVEKIELAEDLFGKDLPLDLPLDRLREIVDYLALQLRGWGPNPRAADFLKKLATRHSTPALAEGLHDSWRRDQISAVIREIFNTGGPTAEGDDNSLIPARKPHAPKSGGPAAASADEEH